METKNAAFDVLTGEAVIAAATVAHVAARGTIAPDHRDHELPFCQNPARRFHNAHGFMAEN